ncbi:glycogen synthase GlgA [Paenibacillus aurantius]|uniref:Glycogen synthase n=1 Tax=Paenibacillus aurantius TaxID=2918900 RepID=A0AA96RDK8_9BACL|nr:glycogen synthase GlgA [Paenibacillus aurantius]WNQ09208.1 glycogen synthase GlgA [Paenibacillus aurantius]
MKLLFAASEAVPFVKSGGLADVIGSLPRALQEQGVEVRVILPKYEDIPEKFRSEMKLVKTFSVYVGWREQYCGLQELEVDGIHYYFIDNEFYFRRKGLYGYGDDAERFVFFSRAVCEALPHLGFDAEILHCHDWQTGLIPFILDAHYRHNPYYQPIRTVFTIHNLKYQGHFSRELLQDLLGVGDDYFTTDGLEFYGGGSCMKAALLYSDIITTVSKTYAEEIQSPTFGENLDGVLRMRSSDLYGIINGIDNDAYDPMSDPCIPVKFRNALGKKQMNKIKLQEELGLPVSAATPMIGIVSRLVQQKGLDLIEHVLEEILEEDVQLVVLGTGEWKYEQLFQDAAWRHPDKISTHITFQDELARKIYAASDMFLMPSQFEPCGLGQLIALRYRSVPIVRETGGLKDTVIPYNEYTGEGTGFGFANYNAHEMLFTIQRAIRYYREPEVWSRLISNISKLDYGWGQAAKQYKFLYDHLSIQKE